MVEGRRFAQNEALELSAWMVAHLLSPYSKKALTVDDILGRKRKMTEVDAAELETKREQARRLLHKIENAQIARREVVGSFSGRGK